MGLPIQFHSMLLVIKFVGLKNDNRVSVGKISLGGVKFFNLLILVEIIFRIFLFFF
jgi:hypothetical protein